MTRSIPIDALESLANVDIGDALRQTRIHYGQTLDDVEKSLRIRACQIDAIERGDLATLPGRAYAIGFVRSYADYLGVDGAAAVRLFKAQYMDGQAKDSLSFPVIHSETKVPSLLFITLSLFVFTFLVIHWQSARNKNLPMREEITKVPALLKTHVMEDVLSYTSKAPPIGQSLETNKPMIEDMSAKAEQKLGIMLNILKNSWVEIKNANGDVIISRVLNEGDSYFVPDSPGLSMSLGNAGHVEILLNGRALKPLGGDGDVRRDIPLETSYLKTLAFQDEKMDNNITLENPEIDNPTEDQQ